MKKIEKEIEEKKKEINNKLRSLLTKLPIFIYLSDNIENSLQDIIVLEEKELFEKLNKEEYGKFITYNEIEEFLNVSRELNLFNTIIKFVSSFDALFKAS